MDIEKLNHCLILSRKESDIHWYVLLENVTFKNQEYSGTVIISNTTEINQQFTWTVQPRSTIEIFTRQTDIKNIWHLVIAHELALLKTCQAQTVQQKITVNKCLDFTIRRDRGLESGNGRELPPLSPPAKNNVTSLFSIALLLTLSIFSFLPNRSYAIDCDYDGYQTLEEKINLESNRLTNWISDSCVLNSNLKLNWLAACGKDDYSLVTLDSLRLDNLHMLVCNNTHCLDNGAVSPHVFDASELSRHGSIVSK